MVNARKKCKRRNAFRVPRKLLIGSDCAGYGTLAIAMRRLRLKFQSVFSYDTSSSCRNVLEHNGAEGVAEDIKHRDVDAAPSVHILSVTPPCTTYSNEGKGLGDSTGVGKLYLHSIRYAQAKKPRVILYENVANQLRNKRHRKVLKRLKHCLRKFNYKVSVKLMNTCLHGVPHNRLRVYLVAIQKGVLRRAFSWPRPIPLKFKMDRVIKPRNPEADFPFKLPGSTPHTANITSAQRLRCRQLAKRSLLEAKDEYDKHGKRLTADSPFFAISIAVWTTIAPQVLSCTR